MTTLYRTEEAPLDAHTITFPFEGITAPPGYILSPEQCRKHGKYIDDSPALPVGYRYCEPAQFDDGHMTVIMSIEPIPASTPETLAQNIKMIEDARLQHLTDNIHPDALFMVYKGYSLGLPKSSLFYSWCESLGLEMYHRIAMTQNGQWDSSLIDFSTFTPKPYEVGEIWQEVSGMP